MPQIQIFSVKNENLKKINKETVIPATIVASNACNTAVRLYYLVFSCKCSFPKVKFSLHSTKLYFLGRIFNLNKVRF